MTLRDHFNDMAESPSSSHDEAHHNHDTDGWTRQYVDVRYLQHIMDAIDDDGSGLITIAEINRFTDMLPSLLGWR